MSIIVGLRMSAISLRAMALSLLVLVASPLLARESPPAASTTISPGDARHAIAILEDSRQRAEALRALKAIADSPATAADAPVVAPAAHPPAAPAGSSSTAAAATPLKADGLTARMLRYLGHWFDGLSAQVRQAEGQGGTYSTLFADISHGLADADQRTFVLRLLLLVACVFVAGLVLEWGLHRLLARPRAALVAHADAMDIEDTGVTTQVGNAATSDPKRGPATDDVALVRTQRDGVDQVEAVPVAPGDGGSGGDMAGAPKNAAPASPPKAPSKPDSSGAHLRTFRHLPYAVASLVLDVLPIALFVVVSGLLLRWFGDGEPGIVDVGGAFIDAYVTVRIGMAIVRVLVSPVGHGLRLIRMQQVTGQRVMKYARHVLVVAAFGVALANATLALGGSMGEREAILKVVSLAVHLLVVVMIFRLRRPVSARLAPPPEAVGPLAMVRHWLADIWAYALTVVIMGLWFVWALGVEDGFSKLLHFVGVTAAVIVVFRVMSVVILGAVSRLFQPRRATDHAVASSTTRIDVHRYYALARGIVSAAMVLGCGIALLQVWGFDALDWFASGIGRSLASAAITILVATLAAIAVWELANVGVNRRLDLWTTQGDLMRATRLRTLVPMLRTCLLVTMVLVVGLTALSQIGVNTGPMLAGASIIGVAVGFGSQKLVQDFITGIFLLMENAMQVGDWVTVGDVSGNVEYLSIRTVRLRGGDGSLYIVPFSSVTTVNNTNRGIGNAAMRIGVAYDTDVQRAMDELKAIGASLRSDPAFQDQILSDIEVWGVDAVDGATITLAGQMRCTDKGRWGVQREINRRIVERFRKAGIVMAYPHTSLLIGPGTAPAAIPTPAQQGTADARGGAGKDASE